MFKYSSIEFYIKQSLNIPKGDSEAVNGRRTDNTMGGQTTQWEDRQHNGRTDNTMGGQTTQLPKEKKKNKGKTMNYKTL